MKYAFIGIILIILILLFIPFSLGIRFTRKNDDDHVEIQFLILNDIIKFNLEIPFIDLINYKDKFSIEIKEKFETGKDETDIKKNKSIITLNKLIEGYKRASKMKEMLGTMLIYLSDKIVIRRLNWDTRIGLDDAALTGISTGILWTFKNLIISFILNHKEIKDLNIDIVPEFNSLVLETDFYCIIKLKMVYIIIAGLNGIKVKIKGGGLNV